MCDEEKAIEEELEFDREAEEALRNIQQAKQGTHPEDDEFDWEPQQAEVEKEQETDEAEMLAHLLSVDLATQGSKPLPVHSSQGHHRQLPTITSPPLREQRLHGGQTGTQEQRIAASDSNRSANESSRGKGSSSPEEKSSTHEHSSHSVSPPNGRPKPKFVNNKNKVPAGLRKLPSPPTNLQQAMMEWDMVETVQPGNESGGKSSPFVNFWEALDHFKTADYVDQHISHIKPTVKHRGCAAIGHALFGPPKMKRSLHSDRNLIFAMALCMFDNDVNMHSFVLQTIYKKLTGTKLDCPRYGNHWELVGFQGVDPSTDLRGCGFLGLMTSLYFVTNPATQSLAIAVYKLSQHEIQNFPFLVMSINITRIALHSLREGVLNKVCNNRVEVYEVFCEYFVAIFCKVYQIWKLQRKTIGDSGYVLKEVEKLAKKDPQILLRNLQQALADKKTIVLADDDKENFVSKMSSFAGVCDLQGDEEDDVHLV